MPERDANQLAADVRAYIEDEGHGEQGPTLAALDELVGLVGTANEMGYSAGYAKGREDSAALVGTLQQERDDALKNVDALAKLAGSAQAAFRDLEDRSDDLFTGLGHMEARAEAAEAALAEMNADRARVIRDLHRTRDLLRDERAALATTRQALAPLFAELDDMTVAITDERLDELHDEIIAVARRALADTGGDTKEPA